MPSVGTVTSNLNVVSPSGSTYTASANDFVVVNAAAAVTVTLPTTPAKNSLVAVRKTDSSVNTVTVQAGTGAAISGGSVTLSVAGATIELQYDGAGTWYTLGDALPSGGAANAVLTKNSTTNYDMSWTVPSSGSGGGATAWTSGRYYTSKPTTTSYTTGTVGAGNTNMTLWPFYVPNACTIATLWLNNENSFAINYRIGLYTDGGGNVTSKGPATLIGTQLVNTMGSQTGGGQAVTGWVIPAAGTYWLAFAQSSGTNVWRTLNPVLQYFMVSAGAAQTSLTSATYTYSTVFPASLSAQTMTIGAYPEPFLLFGI